MATSRGSKPLVTEDLLREVLSKANVVGSKNIPLYIKAYELKERLLATSIQDRASFIVDFWEAEHMKMNPDKPFDESLKTTAFLDMYAMFWLGYLTADLAKDHDFNKKFDNLISGID